MAVCVACSGCSLQEKAETQGAANALSTFTNDHERSTFHVVSNCYYTPICTEFISRFSIQYIQSKIPDLVLMSTLNLQLRILDFAAVSPYQRGDDKTKSFNTT